MCSQQRRRGPNPGADIRIDGIISGDVDYAIFRLIGSAKAVK